MRAGEKIICLKNRHDLDLVNGMFVSLADIQDEERPKPDDDGELRQEPLRRRPDHDHPLDGDHHG